MSFFKKLRDKMFRSSDKIGEGLEALVAESTEAAAPIEAAVAVPVEIAPAGVAKLDMIPAPMAEAKPGLLGRIFARASADEPRRVLDDAMLESLEELLIGADMGVDRAAGDGQHRRRPIWQAHLYAGIARCFGG